MLVQKLAVNADLGFILALVDFFSIDTDPLLEVGVDKASGTAQLSFTWHHLRVVVFSRVIGTDFVKSCILIG